MSSQRGLRMLIPVVFFVVKLIDARAAGGDTGSPPVPYQYYLNGPPSLPWIANDCSGQQKRNLTTIRAKIKEDSQFAAQSFATPTDRSHTLGRKLAIEEAEFLAISNIFRDAALLSDGTHNEHKSTVVCDNFNLSPPCSWFPAGPDRPRRKMTVQLKQESPQIRICKPYLDDMQADDASWMELESIKQIYLAGPLFESFVAIALARTRDRPSSSSLKPSTYFRIAQLLRIPSDAEFNELINIELNVSQSDTFGVTVRHRLSQFLECSQILSNEQRRWCAFGFMLLLQIATFPARAICGIGSILCCGGDLCDQSHTRIDDADLAELFVPEIFPWTWHISPFCICYAAGFTEEGSYMYVPYRRNSQVTGRFF